MILVTFKRFNSTYPLLFYLLAIVIIFIVDQLNYSCGKCYVSAFVSLNSWCTFKGVQCFNKLNRTRRLTVTLNLSKTSPGRIMFRKANMTGYLSVSLSLSKTSISA